MYQVYNKIYANLIKRNLYLILFSYISYMFISCGSGESPFPEITEDYCASIEHVSPQPLSSYMAEFGDRLDSSSAILTLEEGDLAMITRAWLTDAAEKTIDIQYFIFSTDNIGLIAIDYLLRAADRGVKIRMVVDDIMVDADAEDLLALNSHPNLSIKIYNPMANVGKNIPTKLYSLATDFRDFNQRMHNKTFIVDGEVAITGGRNIADEYFDYDHTYNFRDRDVLLAGKVVPDLSSSFEDFWDHPLSVPVEDIVSVDEEKINAAFKFEYIRQYACAPQNFWPEVRQNIEKMPATFRKFSENGSVVWVDKVVFVSDEPGKNAGDDGLKGSGQSTRALISLIQQAKKSISIQSPYLITTELGKELIKKAVDRGVEVKILTNSMSSTDNLEAFSGYRRDRDELLATGADIYEFRPDSEVRFEIMTGALQKTLDFQPIFGLHAKSMVIDKEIAVIGTFNLDPRSANLNTECVAIIYDHDIAERLYQAMETDFETGNAWEVTPDFNPDQFAPWSKRFSVWTRNLVPKAIL